MVFVCSRKEARVEISEIYEDVTLQRTREASDPETGLQMVGFDLSCKVKY